MSGGDKIKNNKQPKQAANGQRERVRMRRHNVTWAQPAQVNDIIAPPILSTTKKKKTFPKKTRKKAWSHYSAQLLTLDLTNRCVRDRASG